MTYDIIKNEERKCIAELKNDLPILHKLLLLLDFNSFLDICGFYSFLKFIYYQLDKEINLDSKIYKVKTLKDTIIIILNTFYNSSNNKNNVDIKINEKLGNNIVDLLPYIEIIPFLKTLIKLELESNVIDIVFDNIMKNLSPNRFKNLNELDWYLLRSVEIIGLVISKIILKNNSHSINSSINSNINSRINNSINDRINDSNSNIKNNQIQNVLNLFCKSFLLTHLTTNIKKDFQNQPNKIFLPLNECVTDDKFVKFNIETYLNCRINKLNDIFRIEQDPIFDLIILKQIDYNKTLYKEAELGFSLFPKEYQSILRIIKNRSEKELLKIQKDLPRNILFKKDTNEIEWYNCMDYLDLIYELGLFNFITILFRYFYYN